jgi:hypothetical protein
MIDPLPDFDTYVRQIHDRERQEDADRRAGVFPGMEGLGPQRWRYIGPPVPLTPEREIFRWWLSAIEARARGRVMTWLARAERPEPDYGEEMARAAHALAGVALDPTTTYRSTDPGAC